jgi:hypothetical protein
MDRLDALVTEALLDKLANGERVWALLSILAARRAEREASLDARMAALERDAEKASRN